MEFLSFMRLFGLNLGALAEQMGCEDDLAPRWPVHQMPKRAYTANASLRSPSGKSRRSSDSLGTFHLDN